MRHSFTTRRACSPITWGFVPLLVLFPLLLQSRAGDDESADTPRILVTNDDGWNTPGLAAIVAALDELGDVVVCAPSENRSGSSQSTEILTGQHEARPVEVSGATEAWALAGTPADTVTYGLVALGGERGFDLVVSGINAGPNVGDVAHQSGTVGAAMHAVGLGVPAIAVSQSDWRDHSRAERVTVELARKLLDGEAEPGVVFSVNVPIHRGEGAQPVVAAPMGGRLIAVGGFSTEEQEDGSVHFRSNLDMSRAAPEGSDLDAFRGGAITISPLRFDWTDRASIDRVSAWEPSGG